MKFGHEATSRDRQATSRDREGADSRSRTSEGKKNSGRPVLSGASTVGFEESLSDAVGSRNVKE